MSHRSREVRIMSKMQKPRVTKDTLLTGKRLLGYVLRDYKLRFIGVFCCILISSIASIPYPCR